MDPSKSQFWFQKVSSLFCLLHLAILHQRSLSFLFPTESFQLTIKSVIPFRWPASGLSFRRGRSTPADSLFLEELRQMAPSVERCQMQGIGLILSKYPG
jgi:hypothetical protein